MMPTYVNKFVQEMTRRSKENNMLLGVYGYTLTDFIGHARRYGINMSDEVFEPERHPTGFAFANEICLDNGIVKYVNISMETDQIFVEVLGHCYSEEIMRMFAKMFDQEPDVFFNDGDVDICAWFYECSEEEAGVKITELLTDNPIRIKKWKSRN